MENMKLVTWRNEGREDFIDCAISPKDQTELFQKELIEEGRWVISELPNDRKYRLLYGNDSLVEANQPLIKHLMRLDDITKIDQPSGLRLAATNREVWLDIDKDTLYQHQTNLELRLSNARNLKQKLEARLSNPSYADKAPAYVVEETREQLDEQAKLIDRLVAELDIVRAS